MRAEDRPVPDPRLIKDPEEHLAFLYAIDLIGDYNTRGNTYWVELHNGHVIDLKLSEVEVFARGIVYAMRHLSAPPTKRQHHAIIQYEAALRALPARW